MLGDGLCEPLGCAAASRCEGDINALEVIVVLQELHLVLLATETISAARAALAAKEHQLVNGEIALIKHAKEFLTYGTTGTYYCYFHLSFFVLRFTGQRYTKNRFTIQETRLKLMLESKKCQNPYLWRQKL
jgi:hypothetical protein